MDGDGYGITVCAVIACGVWNGTINFDYEWHVLEITGHFTNGDQFFYFSTTLVSSVMPFIVNVYAKYFMDYWCG